MKLYALTLLVAMPLGVFAQAPDFTLTLDESSKSVQQGSSVTFALTLNALNGYHGLTTLSVAGGSSQMSAAFAPLHLTGSGTSTLTISTTSSLPAGVKKLTLIATGTVTHTLPLTVAVASALTGDFTIFSAGASRAVTQGSSTTVTITQSNTNGFTDTPYYSVSGLPSGVSPAFSTITKYGVVLTLSADGNAPATLLPATVTVAAISNGLVRSLTFNLTVYASGSAAPQLTITKSSPAAGISINLSAATTGWQFYGGSITHQDNSCFSPYPGSPATPFYCPASDEKYGGSGITPLLVEGATASRTYAGADATAYEYTWMDGAVTTSSSGYTTIRTIGGVSAVMFESDPVLKTGEIYANLYNYYINANGTKTGNGTLNLTFHMLDGSVPDQTISQVISEENTNGLLKASFTFASSSSTYLKVTMTYTGADANNQAGITAATLSGPSVQTAVRNAPNGIQFPAITRAATRGETIVLADDYVWSGNENLPVKPVVTDAAGNRLAITIKSNLNLVTSNYSVQGQRVQLSEAKPQIISPNILPALSGGTGVSDWVFDGLHFVPNNTSDPAFLIYSLINFGPTSLAASTTLADLPNHISVTHCVINGKTPLYDSNGNVTQYYNQDQGIYINGQNMLVADNLIKDWNFNAGQPKEANAIVSQIGDTLEIYNNEATANGEVFMFNVGDVYSPADTALLNHTGNQGLAPRHITMKWNYIWKPLAWQSGIYDKNLIEIKTASDVEIAWNVGENSFEGVFSQGQHGVGFVIQARNAGVGRSTASRYCGVSWDACPAWPWAGTFNINLHDNIIHNTGGGCISMVGPYDDNWEPVALAHYIQAGEITRISNVTIKNNYCDNIDGPFLTTPYGTPPSANGGYRAIGLRGGGSGQGPDNLVVQNNSFLFKFYLNQPIPAGTWWGTAYPAFNVGYDSGAGMLVNHKDPEDVAAGINNVSANQLYDSNIFGWDLACDSTTDIACFDDPQTVTFTNNIIYNAIRLSIWTQNLMNLNTSSPGRWMSNNVSSANSYTPLAGQGASANTLLPAEASIKAGNR